MSEEKKGIVHLKLAKKHPRHLMPFKSIVVKGYEYKPYEINEEMVNDLMKDPGVKHWIKCKELEEDEIEEESEDFGSDEDLENHPAVEDELSHAEEIKGQDEISVNEEIVKTSTGEVVSVDQAAADLGVTLTDKPAQNVDAPAESQEAAPTEFIDENQVIEDKPTKKKNK